MLFLFLKLQVDQWLDFLITLRRYDVKLDAESTKVTIVARLCNNDVT